MGSHLGSYETARRAILAMVEPSGGHLGLNKRWDTTQSFAVLRRTWQVGRGRTPPGTLFERNRENSRFGTPDHPGLKPQGAADFGRFGLWMAPAAPGGVPEDAPRRAVHFGIKITQIGLLWPEFRPKSGLNPKSGLPPVPILPPPWSLTSSMSHEGRSSPGRLNGAGVDDGGGLRSGTMGAGGWGWAKDRISD